MLARRKFIFSASTLMLGTVFAQITTFLFSFLLTRLYHSADYGHYSIFMGCGAVLVPMATGSFEKLILLARSESVARRARYLVAMISATVASVVCLFGIAVWALGATPPLSLQNVDVILLLPAFIVMFAAGQIFVYSCLRQGNMRRIAAFKAGQSLVAGTTQAVLSSFKTVSGLIVGYVVGLLPVAGGCIWYLQRSGAPRPRFRTLLLTARRHQSYPRYVMPNEIVDNFSNQVPLFIIGTYASLTVAGHFSLAMMMLSAPAALAGQAVGQAFLQYISREQNDPAILRRAMVRVWLGMGLLGIVPFSLIFFFGKWIFSLVFGGPWAEAGVIASLLSPVLLARFISSPTSGIYLKLNMQRAQWYFVVAAAVYRLAAYSPLIVGLDLYYCIMMHVAAELVGILAYNWLATLRLKSLASRTGAV